MRSRKMTILALGLSVTASGALSAQRVVRPPRRVAPPMSQAGSQGRAGLGSIVLRDSSLDRFAERLELSVEQRSQLRILAVEYRNNNTDALSRLEGMREEIRALHENDQRPTREAIDDVIERYDHPDLEIALAERRLGRNVRSLLTPDQERRLARGVRRSVRVTPRVLPRARLAPQRGVVRPPSRIRRPSASVRRRLDRRLRRVPRYTRRRPVP